VRVNISPSPSNAHAVKLCPEMREAFSGLNMESVGIQYTIGGATKSKEKTTELIIRNW